VSASGPAIGLELAMSGMYQRAFGAEHFNLYDLVLGGSVGAPGLKSFLVGGGLCFGKPDACAKLTGNEKSSNDKLLYQRLLHPDRLDLFQEDSISVRPHPKMAHEIFGSDQTYWPAYLQEETNELQVSKPALKITAKTPAGKQAGGAIAAKAYIGMDITEGNAYLYAAISEVSLMDLAKAFTDSGDSLPKWLGSIAIKPYDTAACKKSSKSGPACFAYLTLARKEKTITMIKPNLVIPAGFSAQGTLSFFGAEMKFKIAIHTKPSKFEMNLQGAPLKLWNGAIVISKSKDDMKSGPELNAVADLSTKEFALQFNAYAKMGDLGSGSIAVDITNEQAKLDLNVENIYSSGLGAKAAINVNFVNPGESELSAALVLGDKISQPIKAICDAIKSPIQTIIDGIKKALDLLIDASKSTIDAFNEGQSALNSAKASLDQSQRRKDHLYNSVYECNGGWYFGRTWNCGVNMNVYQGYINVARGTLNLASDALSGLRSKFQQVKETLSEAKAKVDEGGKTAIAAIDKVSKFTVKELGFKAKGVTKTVELFAIVGFDGSDTTKHSFTLDLSKGVSGITSVLKGKFLAGIEDAATKILKQIEEKMRGFSEEMELMGQLQDHHRAELVQLGFLKKQINAEGETEYVHPNPEYKDARHEAVVQAILMEKQSQAAVDGEL